MIIINYNFKAVNKEPAQKRHIKGSQRIFFLKL